MKVIVIEDKDARALLDKLELKSMINQYRFDHLANADDQHKVESIYRAFHYVVCGWLQEMGCDISKKY